MTKLLCKCEHSINLTDRPNPADFHVVSELLVEAILEGLPNVHKDAKNVREFEDKSYNLMFRSPLEVLTMIECSMCGRLYVFGGTTEGPRLTFVPETQTDLRLQQLVHEEASAGLRNTR